MHKKQVERLVCPSTCDVVDAMLIVSVIFEFFRECVYIMHITVKTQAYGNNNGSSAIQLMILSIFQKEW